MRMVPFFRRGSGSCNTGGNPMVNKLSLPPCSFFIVAIYSINCRNWEGAVWICWQNWWFCIHLRGERQWSHNIPWWGVMHAVIIFFENKTLPNEVQDRVFLLTEKAWGIILNDTDMLCCRSMLSIVFLVWHSLPHQWIMFDN